MVFPKVPVYISPTYLQTYLERDVRQVSQIRELATFRRFLRTGHVQKSAFVRTMLEIPDQYSTPVRSEGRLLVDLKLMENAYFERISPHTIRIR